MGEECCIGGVFWDVMLGTACLLVGRWRRGSKGLVRGAGIDAAVIGLAREVEASRIFLHDV